MPLEQQIVAALETLLAKYQELEALADQILGQETPISALDAAMIEMKQKRTEIEKLNAENTPLNQRYRDTHEHASLAVQNLTEEIGSLMQRLLMKINQLERSAKSIHETLLPQIHDGVKAVQMKNAYGKYN